MSIKFGRIRRLTYAAVAVAVAGAVTVPSFGGMASAAQAPERSIRMSSSANGATNTTYEINFKTAGAGAVQGVGVDFCSNSPIIGDTCTAPTGFTVGAGTTTGSIAGMTGTWSGAAAQSGRILVLSLGTPGGSASAGAQATFTLTTATNPTNSNTTFYARVYTFATAGNASSWATGNTTGSSITNVVDSGGIALSTAAQITVTAKVQETLTFCVYTQANCGAGGTAVTLGDTNGVLSTAGPFVDKNTKYDISTNAGGASPAATVRFKAPTLTSGGNTIPTIGLTAAASAAGTSQFGLCTYRSAGTLLTPVAPYDNVNCSGTTQSAGTGTTGGNGTAQFAFDTTAANTTFGDDLATTNAGSSNTGIIPFIGNVGPTQAAGIYTSTFTFIATAVY